jgi:hypothetical protein
MAKKNEWTKKGSHKILLPYIYNNNNTPLQQQKKILVGLFNLLCPDTYSHDEYST